MPVLQFSRALIRFGGRTPVMRLSWEAWTVPSRKAPVGEVPSPNRFCCVNLLNLAENLIGQIELNFTLNASSAASALNSPFEPGPILKFCCSSNQSHSSCLNSSANEWYSSRMHPDLNRNPLTVWIVRLTGRCDMNFIWWSSSSIEESQDFQFPFCFLVRNLYLNGRNGGSEIWSTAVFMGFSRLFQLSNHQTDHNALWTFWLFILTYYNRFGFALPITFAQNCWPTLPMSPALSPLFTSGHTCVLRPYQKVSSVLGVSKWIFICLNLGVLLKREREIESQSLERSRLQCVLAPLTPM